MSHEYVFSDGTKATVTNIMADGTECDDLSKYKVPLNDVTYYAHRILFKAALKAAGMPDAEPIMN